MWPDRRGFDRLPGSWHDARIVRRGLPTSLGGPLRPSAFQPVLYNAAKADAGGG
jgi:hypothetical protein